jgi:hypothetical protein
MDSDTDEEGMIKPRRVYFLDTNLDSPVLTTELEATELLIAEVVISRESFLSLWTDKTRDTGKLQAFRTLAQHRQWTKTDMATWAILRPRLYPDAEEAFVTHTGQFTMHYQEAYEAAIELQKDIMDGLEYRGLPRQSIEGTAESLHQPFNNSKRRAYEQFCNLFARGESRTRVNEHAWTHGNVGAADIWINTRHALISFNGTIYISSLNQILLLKDKLATRFMMHEHIAPLRLPVETSVHLASLFAWQDTALRSYDNYAYEILKAVEPLFKTRVSHITDNVFGDDTAYTRMIIKLQEKEEGLTKHGFSNKHLIETLCKIVESTDNLSTLVELYGCQKSCGHPIVDPNTGGLSAAEEARSPDQTSVVDAQKMRNVFCHMVLSAYIKKHGVWPRLLYLRKGTDLEKLNTRQERRITYWSYPLKDWDHVEWTKILEIDYFQNFLELIDDKSISFKRSEKHLTWDHDEKPSSQRRLLLEVLRSDELDIESICRQVSRRDIPYDWFIVSLYPKEREFKLAARMFSMMVIQMRCFFTCLEANLADGIFKYLPQQTMTKSKLQVQEKFLDFTDPGRSIHTHSLMIEIDLSRWNLRWRQLVVGMFGHDLNKMYGVKGTFTVTHWFFALCQIVVRVGGLRPEGIEKELPPETSLSWRHHLGGFEGISQKHWSVLTFAMIEWALIDLIKKGTITSYELIGQGDNQVLRIEIARTEEPRDVLLPRVRDEVNKCIEEKCLCVNQIVKPEENVESTSMMTYSKDVYIRGVEYPTTLKKHSRLFPVTSLDFPSIPNNALAIMAGAVSGAENSRHSLCSLIIGFYHCYRYLRAASSGWSIHGKQAPRFTRGELVGAIIIPPSMGGLVGLPIASFLFKGGSDPLGKEISSLRLLADGSRTAATIAGHVLHGYETGYHLDPNPNLDILIDNPYSIPLANPPSPLSQVSELTLKAFRGKVKNKDIRPLLSDTAKSAETTLREDLTSMRPFNPVVAYDLFQASGFGTIQAMKKMFIATRTVASIASWVDSSITHRFLRADINGLLHYLQFIRNLPALGYSGRCSYELALRYRSYWGIEISGITTYQPMDFFHKSNTTRHNWSIKWSKHSASDITTTRGPIRGYLGSETRQKRSEHGYKIVDRGVPTRALMKLQLLKSEVPLCAELSQLMDQIGLTRSPIVISKLFDILPKVIGGSVVHRHASPIREMAASYVGPLNLVTHLRIDTDTLGPLSGSTKNYPFMVNQDMVYTMATAKLKCIHEGCTSGELIMEVPGLKALDDQTLTLRTPKFIAHTLPSSRLLSVNTLELVSTFDSFIRIVPKACVVQPSAYGDKINILHALVGFFSDNLRDHNKSKVLSDNRGHSSIPSRLKIEIPEAHSLGPKKLLLGIAYAVLNTVLRDTFRTLIFHPDRWDEGLFAVHQIQTCISSCMQYFNHPLFVNHKDYSHFRYAPGQRQGRFSVAQRLEGYVRSLIFRILRNPSDKYWTTSIPCFSGSDPSTVIESVSTYGVKVIYCLRLQGYKDYKELCNWFASMTTLVNIGDQELETLYLSLCSRLCTMAEQLRRDGEFVLAEEFGSLAKGKGIAVFFDSVSVVLREARALIPEEGHVRPLRTSRIHLDVLANLDVCPNCLPPENTSLANELAFHYTWYNSISEGGYQGFTTILHDIDITKRVGIYGDTYGSLSNSLLKLRDCQITGLDLEDKMPLASATLMNYVPLCIDTTVRPRYTQSDLSINTTGLLTEKNVLPSFIDELGHGSTVIIIIDNIHTLIDYPDIITVLSESPSVYNYFFIVDFDSPEEVREIWKLNPTRTWCLACTMRRTFIMEFKSMRTHQCGDKVELWRAATDTHRDLTETPLDLLMSCAVRSVITQVDTNCTSTIDLAYQMSIELLNKPKDKQLLYPSRMDLIYVHFLCALVRSDDGEKLLISWLCMGKASTDLVQLDLRDDLLKYLVSYYPKVSSLLQRGL